MEACAYLEDGIPVGGPPNTNKVVGKTPSVEIAVGPPLLARWSNIVIVSLCRSRVLIGWC